VIHRRRPIYWQVARPNAKDRSDHWSRSALLEFARGTDACDSISLVLRAFHRLLQLLVVAAAGPSDVPVSAMCLDPGDPPERAREPPCFAWPTGPVYLAGSDVLYDRAQAELAQLRGPEPMLPGFPTGAAVAVSLMD
jgi:hypothetical protein